MTSPIVALGASAGGLEALFELFSALPATTGAAYVVIQHLDREHKSLLAELLARKTAMPVAQIEDGVAPQANHVFVIPPNTSLTLVDDLFKLAPRDTSGAPHHPVDVFFISLAESRARSAIAIVLSGGDGDGAQGVKAIKESGGITIAQAPESTRFPSMPQSAIATGCVDFILRPAAIAEEIVRLSQHPYLMTNGAEVADAETVSAPPADDAEVDLRRIFRRLKTVHGVDFSNYKRNTLLRRLARRLALRRVSDMGAYVDALELDEQETRALFQDFLIRVTGFFRDPELFVGFHTQVFPAICSNRKGSEPIRIWVAGCATGEEVYSIAIALSEYLGDPIPHRRVQIFGTDVSESAIDFARAGVYADHIETEMSGERLARYFVKSDGGYHVSKRIRDLCIFARHDVTRDPPFSRIELLSCRNLLIYLDAGAQRRVMRAFHYALAPRGFLALGLSESVGNASDLFELIDKKKRIYSRKVVVAASSVEGVDPPGSAFGQIRAAEAKDLLVNSVADSVQRESDRVLVNRYSPPSLLVDDSLNILQFRGETGRYIEHASGSPSLHLHRVVKAHLLVEISPAIQQARESGAPVWREGLRVDDQSEIGLGVIPLRSGNSERCFLIIFEDDVQAARRNQKPSAPVLTESEKDRRLAQLERELASTRSFLQSTIEEQESAREDLKSAHEEVMSANEEFQSTNEELETAKEELQSSNEELATTNDELVDRNRELSSLNAELGRTREIAVRAEAYADAIVASVRTPLLVLDRELRVLRANRSFQEEFGLQRESTEGRTLRDIGGRQWDNSDLLVQLTKVLTQDLALIDYEMQYQSTPASAKRILRIDAHTIPGDAERAELILFSIEDVTERKTRANALEFASQRKDEFMAMLAHELRNPLTPISHAIHLLQRDDFEGSPAHLHGMIERQTRRLVRLVDDLLDLARINRGQIELRNLRLDLRSVVQSAAESIQFRIAERRHELTVSVPSDPVFVEGDSARLAQIISNLLENAAKYTNPGGRIDVRLTEQDGQAVLSVRDNGIGLASEHLAVIFELFDQVDRSMSRSGGGLGIGLTLVRRVLQLHGGSVEAQSAGAGHGAEFIVRLPISQRTEESLEESAASTTAVVEIRRSVLIVDDNADAVESLQMLIDHWGHDVSTAHTGDEALASVLKSSQDVALIDIGLPDISGYEVANRLRGSHPGMFLIAMTGYGRAEDRKAALAAGFDAHVVKPADIDELQKLLNAGRPAA